MTATETTPLCVSDIRAELGEGPVWLARDIFGAAALYSVDILGRRIHRLVPESGEARHWDAPAKPGFLAPYADGRFICGLKTGLHLFDPRDGSFALLAAPEADRPDNRLNDGFVAPDGRLWFGSMDDLEQTPCGHLYAYDGPQDGGLAIHDSGYIVTNGPTLSPDAATLYHSDSARQRIYAFDHAQDGRLTDKRVFVTLEDGYPDGLATDEAGYLWVAVFAGGRVLRFAPDGTLDRTVRFPCRNVTKIAFGGPDRRTAYATTAWKTLTPEERAAEPQAGSIFAFPVPVPGLVQNVLREHG